MNSLVDARRDFYEWVDSTPRSHVDAILAEFKRRRLENPAREKRKRLSKSKMRDLFFKQKGKCPLCGNGLNIDFSGVEVDHTDPNRQDFNALANLQLTHEKCNREKGPMSVMQQTKHYNRTALEILGDER